MSKVNFLDESFISNPFPIYQSIRETDPIYRFILPNGEYAWIVTTYEYALKVLKDPRYVINPTPNEKEETDPYKAIMSKNLLSVHSDDHRRLRKLVQKAFTPKMIENLRGRIEEISEELLDKVESHQKMDLIDDYAFPLPIIVICEMLGIPEHDQDKFRSWSNTIMEGIHNPEQATQSEMAIISFVDYLKELITLRKSNLKNDLLSDLIRAEEDGNSLSENEMYALVFVLILAGHETSVNLIGNGVLALLEHPEQKDKLIENPHLIHSAIEEMLRFNGPAEVSNIRWTTEDVELGEKKIKAGEMVFISFSSANRDKSRFVEPESFDITRKVNDHLAFGKGVHFCLGAPLARLEGEIAIRSLFKRLPDLRLDGHFDQIQWRPGMIIRGAKKIPIVFNF
ncbi:cytochrome P450 [Bacillus pumilus]|uniref:cytochrome P450 family protein n=1 Tax=Bacillus pumilus TaxID=1408 RepID=UPI0031F4D956